MGCGSSKANATLQQRHEDRHDQESGEIPASIPDAQESNAVLPRVIVSLDVEKKIVHVERKTPNANIFAISHRWADRNAEGAEVWTVACPSDTESYDCILFPGEVNQLGAYIRDGYLLWLDYVCINQASAADKCAQVSIMGQIYFDCTTFPTGNNLEPTAPPDEYFDRGWTFQERNFGQMRFSFDINELSTERLQKLSLEFGRPLPEINPALWKVIGHYSYDESWRYDVIIANASKMESNGDSEKGSLLREVAENMEENNHRGLALAMLKFRLASNCSYLPDDPIFQENDGNTPPNVVLFQTELFRVDVTYQKDKLYGIWGVPAYLKSETLDYDDPLCSWEKICKVYPWAEFAFYAPLDEPDYQSSPYCDFTDFADVSTIIMCAISEPNCYEPKSAVILETTEHEFRSPGKYKFTVAWGRSCIGFAIETEPNILTFYLVASYDSLSLQENKRTFRIQEAFMKLYELLWAKGLCENDWRQPFSMQSDIIAILPQMISKHGIDTTWTPEPK